ncbi:helix-turn-helix transcriptional regulator [Anaerotruncus rubiinfantis]|uniref:helix-turn-helix transcriptional regulator n=1 Tax=Anaerotruncus rubiinfantis TaxID=1720200 RepID=UPI0034A38346
MQISLKAARVNAGLKQREAAKAVGVDVTTIIKWENGKTVPRADQLQTLCRVYNTPIDFIFLREKSTLS